MTTAKKKQLWSFITFHDYSYPFQCVIITYTIFCSVKDDMHNNKYIFINQEKINIYIDNEYFFLYQHSINKNKIKHKTTLINNCLKQKKGHMILFLSIPKPIKYYNSA